MEAKDDPVEHGQEQVPIGVIEEDVLTCIAPGREVIQGTRGEAGHRSRLLESNAQNKI